MLYQKLRPTSLDDMLGSKAAIEGLKAVLAQDERPHAYLLTGGSGLGKTSSARILGKELDCGILEINAAQSRGIDTIRELEKRSVLSPLGNKARMVIIDEAHAMTGAAQNCLLKIIEDIPKHQYYVLVSTEPDKIIATIRNRCAVYTFSNLRPPQMKELLSRSVEQIGADVEPEVLEMIRIAAEGCPRQALVMLEQVIGMDPLEALDAMQSGTISHKGVKDLCQGLMSKKYGMLKVLKSIEGEPESIRQGILGYMGAVATNNPSANSVHMILRAFLSADTYRSGRAALICAVMDCEE